MGESAIRLARGDLERLLASRASAFATGYACRVEGGELLVVVRGARIPRLESMAPDLTLAIRASLAPEERNVALAALRLHEAPFGLAPLLAPFVDRVVEGMLDDRSRAFVTRKGPGSWRLDLGGLPLSGRTLGETLTLTSLEVPGRDPDDAATATVRIEG